MKPFTPTIVLSIALFTLPTTGFPTLSLQQKRTRLSIATPSTDLQEPTYSKYHQPIHNIVRDLNGNPLTNEYFTSHMGIPVESYVCPEEDAFRGFMSNASRVKLLPSGTSAFYKCIIFKDIGHAWEKRKRAPFKLVRDIKSYEVVANFLNSKACRLMVDATGVVIPKCFDAQLKPDYVEPMESKFSFLLEDLNPADGWYQKWLVDSRKECEVCLKTYAKIHAFFWEGSDFWKDTVAGKELEDAVWQSGSYVQPHAQPPDQYLTLTTEWARKKMKFEKQLSTMSYWDDLGERLSSVAHECGRHAHPFAEGEPLSKYYAKYRTFTHGDPKQANIFFRRCDNDKSNLEVGLIDFQWSGFGLASSDIAHFLTSAVYVELLEGSGEESLMRYYYDELQKHLVEYGVFQSLEDAKAGYSWESFVYQYETAILDLCRLIIGYTWDRFTEPVDKGDEAAKIRTMNKTSYNKSIPNAVWLMSRCDSILKNRGV